MEIGLSMVNAGETIRGYLVNVEKDDVGELLFTNSLGTMYELVNTKCVTIEDIVLGDTPVKAIYADRKDGKVSGLSTAGKVLMHGNLLIAGMDTHKGPLRSLTGEEMQVVKEHIGMMDVGEGASMYNTYCLCNIETA